MTSTATKLASTDRIFPTLYQKASGGRLKTWNILVEKLGGPGLVANQGIIVTRWGLEGGALQQTRDVVAKGKNVGKKNETTPFEQACAEAQAKWEKQQKKGYHEDRDAALLGKVDEEFVEGGLAPMLAAKFHEDGDSIVYPASAQPKLDGHRCVAIVKDGACTLWSRSRKPILSVPHIARAVEAMAHRLGLRDLLLDGELYNHGLHDNFQKLSGLLRKQEPQPECAIVQYHVYDVPNAMAGGFRNRFESLMADFADEPANSPLILVETIEVANEDEVLEAADHFLALGYEGLIVRNSEGAYHHARNPNDRSLNLQKVKKFEDNEYRIVGVEEGRGKLAGHAIFVCERIVKGIALLFNAKMKGEQAALKKYFEKPPIGAMLTVKHQGYYKSGVPRIPVAWRMREDI